MQNNQGGLEVFLVLNSDSELRFRFSPILLMLGMPSFSFQLFLVQLFLNVMRQSCLVLFVSKLLLYLFL